MMSNDPWNFFAFDIQFLSSFSTFPILLLSNVEAAEMLHWNSFSLQLLLTGTVPIVVENFRMKDFFYPTFLHG